MKTIKRSKSEMLVVLLADAVGSMYRPALPKFGRTKRHTVSTIRRALNRAGLLVDPA